MKSMTVSLKTPTEVKDFVNIINKYPYDVDLRSGRYTVDAKSMLGIFSLDLSRPLTLEIFNDSSDDLIAELEDYR